MKKSCFLLIILLTFSCNDNPNISDAFVPQSSGKINHVTVVMPEKDWNSLLGEQVRNSMELIFEGLPLDEPQYSLVYMNPKAFSGFARQNRNILLFQKDTLVGLQLSKNKYARPQILAKINGPDAEVQGFYLEENAALIRQTIAENERIEKLRRIKKSPTTEKTLSRQLGISLIYPSAYKTVKDTTNFVWVQKPIRKGHLNIIAYNLPENVLKGKFNERILNIRDSIGKLYVPGRLKGSYLITERAFKPYFYKTKLNGKMSYLTKGTWEVANDFMAGPFVNYMIHDTDQKKWIVLEGFVFAPSISKREYMFELNTIISTFKKEN